MELNQGIAFKFDTLLEYISYNILINRTILSFQIEKIFEKKGMKYI